MDKDDWLSIEPCLACRHPRFLHRSDNGACFADPNKTNAPSGSSYSLAEIEVRKKLLVECWCVAFTGDPKQASTLILKHGDHTALRRGIEEALDRADAANAQRLRTRLIRETSEANRDARWLDDVERRITSLRDSRSPHPMIPQSEAKEQSSDMMNIYPKSFSRVACAIVEADKVKAHRDFKKQREDAPVGAFEEVFRDYVLRVFLSFTGEACKVGRQGLLTVPEIRGMADEFLRRFTIEAYYEDGFDRSGRRLGEMTSHLNGSLLAEAGRKFRKSSQWQQFEDDLLRVAESHIANPDFTELPNSRSAEVKSGRTQDTVSVSDPALKKSSSHKRSKKTDLSRYLDGANLTEKQYQCMSLKLEYGVSVAEIARELTLHRKTVDQHISAGQSKMRSSGQYETVRRRLAQKRPEE